MGAKKIDTFKIVGKMSTVGKLSVGKLSTPLYMILTAARQGYFITTKDKLLEINLRFCRLCFSKLESHIMRLGIQKLVNKKWYYAKPCLCV